VLLSLYFICLIPVYLVKERALTEILTDILLIEEKRFLYFLNAYIGSPGGYPSFCTLYVGAFGSFFCFQVRDLLYFYSLTPEKCNCT
jgi:hypothetical protein